MHNPNVDLLTHVAVLPKFQLRLAMHYEAGTPLAKYIQKDDSGYWIEPFATKVLYLEDQSIMLGRLEPWKALGTFDENGVQTNPSLIEALNTDPSDGSVDPVIRCMATGNCRDVNGPTDPFMKLSEEDVQLVRLFHPETIELEGETITRGLAWERLA